jgi:tetratricopeptide (TPR) repeat protein
MFADSRFSRFGICHQRTNCGSYSKKVNQLSRLVIESATSLACLVLALFFLLTSLAAAAETPDTSRRTFIHGLIATAQGQPVARATVELRDLRGVKIAAGSTDSAGRFAIITTAKAGEYVLLVAKELQIGDERITLDQPDREVAIALPVTSASVAATSQPMYTVSAQELRVPEEVRKHLKLAHQEFSKLNFAGAEKEVDRALQIDSMCAAAFSMRALLRLASRDFNGAIEAATRALALDSGEADAYVALATAHNSLREFQSAETAAQQALSRRSDFWQGRLEMAKALYGEGRCVLALREVDELSNDFPDVHLVRANILQRLDRHQEAAEEFSQFLREAPNDPRSEQVKRIVGRTSERATESPSFQP